MRTAIILAAGFVLWAVCIGIAKLVARDNPKTATIATAVFSAIWFAVAATNMWVGVTQAGYSIMEELPIFCLIFLLPVGLAVLVKWKFL